MDIQQMEDDNVNINLINLYCYFVEEEGFDDVYLKYNKEKIWPLDEKQKPVYMDSVTSLDVKITGLKVGEGVDIQLWDWDRFSADDLLGTFSFLVENKGGPYTTDMSLNLKETKKARYTLEWEVE